MSETQQEIDNEEADLWVLEENLSKLDGLSNKLSQTLVNMAVNAQNIEDAISPIAGTTQSLTILGNNLNAAIEAVNNLKQYGDIVLKEETIIRNRPQNTGVKPYIDSIQRCTSSFNELQESNLKMTQNVMNKLHRLVNIGEDNLLSELEQILRQESPQLDAYGFISKGESLPVISGNHLSQIKQILNYFLSKNLAEQPKIVYSTVRGEYVLNSLQGIMENCRMFIGQLNKPYTRGDCNILACTNTLIFMLKSEAEILSEMQLNPDFNRECIHSLAIKPVTGYTDLISELLESCRRNMPNASLFSLELYSCLEKASAIQGFVHHQQGAVFATMKEKVVSNSTNIFPTLIYTIERKVQEINPLPANFGLVEVTNEVIRNIENLAEFSDTVAYILSGMNQAGGWFPTARPQYLSFFNSLSIVPDAIQPSTSEEVFAAYISDVIDDLLINLETRGKTVYKQTAEVGLFFLTNYMPIERLLNTKEILANIFRSNRTSVERLDKLRRRGLNMFLDGWKNLGAILMEASMVRPTGAKSTLASKDREFVKEKFKAFNAGLEELVSKQKSFHITDPNLKALLSKEITFILPIYHRMYDQHIGGDFSKHTEKYIKYDKRQFDDLMYSLA